MSNTGRDQCFGIILIDVMFTDFSALCTFKGVRSSLFLFDKVCKRSQSSWLSWIKPRTERGLLEHLSYSYFMTLYDHTLHRHLLYHRYSCLNYKISFWTDATVSCWVQLRILFLSINSVATVLRPVERQRLSEMEVWPVWTLAVSHYVVL